MKIRTVIIALFALVASFGMQGQTVKIGHINQAELLNIMPDKVKADNELKKYAESLTGTFQTMFGEYQKKLADLEQNLANLPDPVKQTKAKELQEMKGRIEQFEIDAQQDLAKKEQAVYQPIVDKVKGAIQAVAKENGYKYIFDTSMGNPIYSEPSDNVLGLVKAKLGL